MNLQNFEQARQYAEGRLENELSSKYVYHCVGHTRDEVVPAVQTLAAMEGIRGRSLRLLLTAAWFHDLGYVEKPYYHELISARIAVQVLPSFGYDRYEVEVVRWAILATALPQWPQNRLEQVLVDADLDVLGQNNFMERNADLRREFHLLDRESTDWKWYTGQIKFVEGHQYFTASARALRDRRKQTNIEELKKIVTTLQPE